MQINLKHTATGAVKQTKLGFSWTTFFFGFFPAIFRGDWKWTIIQLLVGAVTFGLSNLVFIFIYNKLYVKDLLENGYVPADEPSKRVLQMKGLIANG